MQSTPRRGGSLKKASDDGIQLTDLKPMRLQSCSSSRLPSVTVVEIRGTSPFRQVSTPVLGMVHGVEGEGLGGPDGLWAETGTPAFHQSCQPPIRRADPRCLEKTTAALRTGTAEREGKEAGMRRIWPHGSPGKQPRRVPHAKMSKHRRLATLATRATSRRLAPRHAEPGHAGHWAEVTPPPFILEFKEAWLR